MTLEIKHSTVVNAGDWPNDPSSPVGTNAWNAVLNAAMETGFLLGRTAAGAGPVQELSQSAVRTFLALAAVAISGSAEDLAEGATKKLLTTAERAKMANITVTQAVDLDAIEARVNGLDAAVILKGSWSAAAGTFPGAGIAQAGETWIVSAAGTVNGQTFAIGDRIMAILDNASTSTVASNWFKLDYTDQVLSVAGLTGAMTAAALKAALAIVVGDITDASANGRSLIAAADYSAMRILLGLVIGTNVQAYDASTAKLNVDQAWSGAQRGVPTALVSGSSISVLLADGNDYTLTLGTNATLANPSDIATFVGQKGSIAAQQDATGGRTLAVGSFWFPIGAATVPSLPTAAGAKFRIDYHVVSATRIDFSLQKVGTT